MSHTKRKLVEFKTTGIFDQIAENMDSRILCLYGGSSCFGSDQLVITDNGSIPISKIKKGAFVRSWNEGSGRESFNKVTDTFKYRNDKKTLRVTLKNGSVIIATEDHKFYHKGAWVSLKQLVSLWEKNYDGNMEINTRV